MAVAVLSALLTGTAARAATADTTPPTAPFIGYAEGFYCLTVIIGANRSTDNVTPQSGLRYEAFADGVPIGALTDRGQPPGPWGTLHLPKAGLNTITVRAITILKKKATRIRPSTMIRQALESCQAIVWRAPRPGRV